VDAPGSLVSAFAEPLCLSLKAFRALLDVTARRIGSLLDVGAPAAGDAESAITAALQLALDLPSRLGTATLNLSRPGPESRAQALEL